MKISVPLAAGFGLFVAASAANADMTGNVFQVSSSGVYSGDGAFGAATFNGGITDLWMEFDDANDCSARGRANTRYWIARWQHDHYYRFAGDC